MNYYNPYFYTMPSTMINTTRGGLFSRLFGGITFGKFIDGTQRALNFANQAIPFIKQVRPMIGNAKTMFKVMNEFKRQERKDVTEKVQKYSTPQTDELKNVTNSGPTFFA